MTTTTKTKAAKAVETFKTAGETAVEAQQQAFLGALDAAAELGGHFDRFVTESVQTTVKAQAAMRDVTVDMARTAAKAFSN